MNGPTRFAIRSWTVLLACGLSALILGVPNANLRAWQDSKQRVANGDAEPGVNGTVLDAEAHPASNVRIFYAVRPERGTGWGRVVAETKTDALGRFHVPWPKGTTVRRAAYEDTIWAYRPGSLLASERIPNHGPTESFEARLALGLPARTVFDIRNPDGLPIAGAKIYPRVLIHGSLSVPDELAKVLESETVTDERGRAVMTAVNPEDLNTFFVKAKGFGSQQFGSGLRDVTLAPRLVTLLPVGSVKGKIVGPVVAVAGHTLTVGTNSRQYPSPYPGLVETQIDQECKFEVRDLATGNLRLRYHADFRSPWTLRVGGSPTVEAGKTTKVEVTLEPLVPVTGIVRDKVSGRPLVGIPVATHDYSTVPTDAEGRYHIHMAEGRGTFIIAPMPDAYALPRQFAFNVNITKREPEFELPVVELLPARVLRGRVVDERDKPVLGAVISYFCYENGPRGIERDTKVFYRSDSSGHFEIPHVPIGLKGEINASYRGLTLSKPLNQEFNADKELVLHLDSARQTKLFGRVLDQQGQPVVGASVRIRHQRRYDPSGQIEKEELVDSYGEPAIRTDKHGRFQTPSFLDKQEEYAAYVTLKGFTSAKTDWTYASEGSFADLILAPELEPGQASKKP